MTAPLHLLTPEYPPSVGGVAAYTRRVAAALAAGGAPVAVWTPTAAEGPPQVDPGVTVHALERGFAPVGLGRLAAGIDAHPRPRRLLVQWVPHGFGWRSLNLPFCHWLRRRSALTGDRVELMVHEPFLAFGPGVLRSAAAATHRLMVATLLRAASRLYVATESWGAMLAPYRFGHDLEPQWLPLPSTVPVVDDPVGRREIRRSLAPEAGLLVGHFGTYGPGVRELLAALLPELRRRLPGAAILLLGQGGRRFAAELRSGGLDLGDSALLHATGPLSEESLSLHLGACDLLVQPYPDGVSGRRTTAIAGLAHGIAVATTTGPLTEPIWAESGAVALAPADEPAALAGTVHGLGVHQPARLEVAAAGSRLYDRRFALRHTVETLRRDPGPPARLSPG